MNMLLLCFITAVAAVDLLQPLKSYNRLPQAGSSGHFADNSVILAIDGECRIGEVVCRDGCMPILAECCTNIDGYCKVGLYCSGDGCCPDGKTCGGPATICDKDEVPCGPNRCMPIGSVCCGDGSHCKSGEVCTTDRHCIAGVGSGSGNGGGSGGGGGGGSGGDSGPQCTADQVKCGNVCAPKGSECCGNAQKFCQLGFHCNVMAGTCSPNSPGGGGTSATHTTTSQTLRITTSAAQPTPSPSTSTFTSTTTAPISISTPTTRDRDVSSSTRPTFIPGLPAGKTTTSSDISPTTTHSATSVTAATSPTVNQGSITKLSKSQIAWVVGLLALVNLL